MAQRAVQDGTVAADGEFDRGWPVLLAATIGVGLGTTGLPFYSFGQFVRPLAATFHWNRGEISGGVLCLMIGTVLISPLVGRAVDRLGVRAVALSSQLGLAIGFLLLSLVGAHVWSFYAAWLALSVLGAGTSPIVWTRAIAGWFVRRRGFALGIMLSGTGLVAIIAPVLVNAIIGAAGWRSAYRVLAVVLAAGMPITFALLRMPDERMTAAPPTGTGATAAMRSAPFRRICIGFVLISIAVAGLIVHLPALLVDHGLTPAGAAATLAWLGYAIIVGRLALGLLMDRLPPHLIGAAFVLLAGVASLLLAGGAAPWLAVLLLGLAAGAEVDLLAFLVSRIFGLRHYAQIYGWGMSAFTAGAGIGPLVAGTLHDRTGSYTAALFIFALAIIGAAALVASLGRFLTPPHS